MHDFESWPVREPPHRADEIYRAIPNGDHPDRPGYLQRRNERMGEWTMKLLDDVYRRLCEEFPARERADDGT